jgi:hypothetical protein
MRVYILLFNAGTDNEGIHSLQANGRNTVLMFEDEDDALRFGLMLEAQDFPSPTVEAIEEEDVTEFCQGAGLDCKLVPTGTLVTPPRSRSGGNGLGSRSRSRRPPPARPRILRRSLRCGA